MPALGIAFILVYVGLGIVAFCLFALFLRWILGINKIVNLLGVIAQEIRASNAVQDVDAKLKAKGVNEKLGDFLNQLGLKEYKITVSPAPATPPQPPAPAPAQPPVP